MLNDDIILSQKPYLIRAMYEWMLDHGYTPRLIACPLVAGVILPAHILTLEQVTLDISPQAIANLELGNQQINFEAHFDRHPFDVILPMDSIASVVAKEKEVGYIFDIEDAIPTAENFGYAQDEVDLPPSVTPTSPPTSSGSPTYKQKQVKQQESSHIPNFNKHSPNLLRNENDALRQDFDLTATPQAKPSPKEAEKNNDGSHNTYVDIISYKRKIAHAKQKNRYRNLPQPYKIKFPNLISNFKKLISK